MIDHENFCLFSLCGSLLCCSRADYYCYEHVDIYRDVDKHTDGNGNGNIYRNGHGHGLGYSHNDNNDNSNSLTT